MSNVVVYLIFNEWNVIVRLWVWQVIDRALSYYTAY